MAPKKMPAALLARARKVLRLAEQSTATLARAVPRGDRVLVLRDLTRDTTPSGIVVADLARSKSQTGTVVRVGPGRLRDDGTRVPIDDLHPGQRVLITGWAGLELNEAAVAASERDEYVLLREEDLIARFPEEEEE